MGQTSWYHSQLQFSKVKPQADNCYPLEFITPHRIEFPLHHIFEFHTIRPLLSHCHLSSELPNLQFLIMNKNVHTNISAATLNRVNASSIALCFFLYSTTSPPPSYFLSWDSPQCIHVYALYIHTYQVFKDSHISNFFFYMG